MRQTCKVCGLPDKFDFNVPDDIWSAVVPGEHKNHVVCLSCFDNFAANENIDISGSIETLYFAGNAAAFEFHADEDDVQRLEQIIWAAVRAFVRNDEIASVIDQARDGHISYNKLHRELHKIYDSFPAIEDGEDVADMVCRVLDVCGIAMDEEEFSRFLGCEIESAKMAIKKYIRESNYGGGEL